MKNAKSRIKLFIGILFVTALCFSLAIYTDNQAAKIGSNSAELQMESYAVGSEYSGIITKQYVNTGDHVTQGSTLFELSNDVLKQQLKNGDVKAEDLSYKISTTNTLLLVASHDGTVGKINFLQGSFVTAGDIIATISDTKQAVINAEYYLSNPQYAQLNPRTPVSVILAGNARSTGTITSINQSSHEGKTLTTIKIAIDKLDDGQVVYDNSSPVYAELTLNTNTLYQRLRKIVSAYTN